jgi:hypothetical protein
MKEGNGREIPEPCAAFALSVKQGEAFKLRNDKVRGIRQEPQTACWFLLS